MSVFTSLLNLINPFVRNPTPKAYVLPQSASKGLEPSTEFLDYYFEWVEPDQWMAYACPEILACLDSLRAKGIDLVGVALDDPKSSNTTFFVEREFVEEEFRCNNGHVCNAHFQMISVAEPAARASFLQTDKVAIRLDRDSVCAGDDVSSHRQYFGALPTESISTTIQTVLNKGYLASIRGGEAAWQIEVIQDQGSATVIGIAAEQWETPKFKIDPSTSIKTLFPDGIGARLFFRYLQQVDPDRAFENI